MSGHWTSHGRHLDEHRASTGAQCTNARRPGGEWTGRGYRCGPEQWCPLAGGLRAGRHPGTTDTGATWNARSDGQRSLAIGAIAFAPTGLTVYAGTGEANGSTLPYRSRV